MKNIIGIIVIGFIVLNIGAGIANSNKPKAVDSVTPPVTTYQEAPAPVAKPAATPVQSAPPAEQKPVYVTPKPASNCDPNYSGCVPIASDVDCAGGKGNGPAYVRGPIRVIGRDIYGLDRDGDGIACE